MDYLHFLRETAGNRIASCGHKVAEHLYVEDAFYGDALCFGCFKAREARLRTFAAASGSYAGYERWKTENLVDPPDSGLSGWVKVASVEVPAAEDNEDFDVACVREAESRLFRAAVVVQDRARPVLEARLAAYGVDTSVLLHRFDGEYYLTPEAFEESIPRLLHAWREQASKDTESRWPYQLEEPFWNALGERVGVRVQQAVKRAVTAERMGEEIEVPVFPEPPPKVAAFMTVEQVIDRVSESTTVIYGETPEVKWSGTAWRATEKHLVTCAHVVNVKNRPGFDEQTSLMVLTKHGHLVPVKVVYVNYDIDAAVLEIEPEVQREFGPPLPLGDSDAVIPGEQIITVGAPEGIDQVASVGHIASTERHIPEILSNVLFLDMSIYPGSSGGPVVNMRGEVIGIARGSHHRGKEFDEGLNYCVPIRPIRSWLDMRLGRV